MVQIPILPTLRTRAEFLSVRGGRRASTRSFLIETRDRPRTSGAVDGPRFGFTITKKLGNAVVRNRIRRRLKAAFAAERAQAMPTADYVVVARLPSFDCPYVELLADVRQALVTLQNSTSQSSRMSKPRRGGETAKKGAP